ncbi:hypothetical protein PGT21_013175 [Puccinia graminis f. sp. tritici]|uniref:Uncharacterized protein n=1 Tax=Puccinia graminis f. sp. tritici TaxID=56615 RepID=A0A5B0QA54_PUCGR|nr:hypothetical protein PGT21_013175 [Puccinia graminis f. sp. tritici]
MTISQLNSGLAGGACLLRITAHPTITCCLNKSDKLPTALEEVHLIKGSRPRLPEFRVTDLSRCLLITLTTTHPLLSVLAYYATFMNLYKIQQLRYTH